MTYTDEISFVAQLHEISPAGGKARVIVTTPAVNAKFPAPSIELGIPQTTASRCTLLFPSCRQAGSVGN